MQPEPRDSRRSGVVLAGLLLVVAACDLHACTTTGGQVRPVPSDASLALARARELQRRGGGAGRVGEARSQAENALVLEREWVAPRRFLDDIARTDLVAHASLAEHLEALSAADPADAELRARLLYLIGRLEGAQGTPRFEQAARLDGSLAWAQHGLGWMKFTQGSPRAAQEHSRRARALARDGWEWAYFAQTESRYLFALERHDRAAELLSERGEVVDALTDSDRAEHATWSARAQLRSEDSGQRERGYWSAIDLLRGDDLVAQEVRDLTNAALQVVETDGQRIEEIEAALAARPGAERTRLRGRILFERGATALALGVLDPVASSGIEARSARAARIAAGEIGAVVEEWLRELPAQVLDADGLPARPELAALVRSARAGDESALAQALLAAGWFAEARGLANHVAPRDLPAALELDARAATVNALLEGIRRLLELVDRGGEYAGPRSGATSARSIRSLDDLLDALQPFFERHRDGGDLADLARTPRLRYGSVATVLHPGPTFSALDAAQGLGLEGDTVGGLGTALLALGRFGIFGETLGGGGPDGTVLRLLALTEREGEHLGVPFRGTVAWCEGVDVPSRLARRGARITGAALHEGYWIDVAGVRADHERWRSLERTFLESDRERARRALEANGPRLAGGDDGSARLVALERARVYAPLGEGDRLRLAVLSERTAGPRGRVTLEELLEVTARHEEGHLLDRSRFLPVSRNPLGVLGLLADAGFSPAGLERLLEYRAQLVCLAVADDPRIPLAECLDGAEGEPGVSPHGAAYSALLADLLEVLEASREEEQLALDPERYLIHQLHRVDPETLRRVALRLARKQGMVREH